MRQRYGPKIGGQRSARRTGKAWALLKNADQRLPPRTREAWRWRILYLGGLIDAELAANDGRVTARCEGAFEELTGIYHAAGAALLVSPLSQAALCANRRE